MSGLFILLILLILIENYLDKINKLTQVNNKIVKILNKTKLKNKAKSSKIKVLEKKINDLEK
jgi:hypothetical protein